jgi:hypothetical protein
MSGLAIALAASRDRAGATRLVFAAVMARLEPGPAPCWRTTSAVIFDIGECKTQSVSVWNTVPTSDPTCEPSKVGSGSEMPSPLVSRIFDPAPARSCRWGCRQRRLGASGSLIAAIQSHVRPLSRHLLFTQARAVDDGPRVVGAPGPQAPGVGRVAGARNTHPATPGSHGPALILQEVDGKDVPAQLTRCGATRTMTFG